MSDLTKRLREYVDADDDTEDRAAVRALMHEAADEIRLLREVFSAVDKLDGHETYDKRVALQVARTAYRRWQERGERWKPSEAPRAADPPGSA